jgi:hypothetical protein
MPRSIIFLILFACGVAAGATPAIEVPFTELVNHPRKYNGKRISVRAYVATSCTHCGEFWATVQSARDSRVHDNPVLQCIAIGGYRQGYLLPKSFARRLGSQDYDGYVHVTGRFEYVHKFDGKRYVDALHGFGWSRLDDKQITDITELRPLGTSIPAHIN